MRATTYQFAHYRTIDGERYLIWGNGIGEVLIPVTSGEYRVALGDRSWQDNDLVNEGEDDILNIYFRGTAKRSTLYGRLYDVAAPPPAETVTLATIGTEVSGTGYAAVSWTVGNTDFGAPADDAGAQETTSTTKTFTAGGTWTAADHLGLTSVATTTTGTLIAWAALAGTRTLTNLDTLDVSVAIKLA